MSFRYSMSYQDNETPLLVASQKGHNDVVKTLLGAGADVNITTSDVSDVIFMPFFTIHVHVCVHVLESV